MNNRAGNKYKKYPSKCFACGKDTLVFLASLENKRNFCSDKCENKWRSAYWKELQKKRSFGFQKGHKIGLGNKHAVGNHPRSEWKLGHIPWNKGILMSEEDRLKMGDLRRGKRHSNETREKMRKVHGTKANRKRMSRLIKLRMKDPEMREKISKAVKIALSSKEVRKKISKTWFKRGFIPWNKGLTKEIDKRLDHPELREERARKLFEALKLSPNKSERKLIYLLAKILPKEYKFVGNGKIFIESLVPDFININGQKKIIELYGDYWHKKKKKRKRDKRRLKIYSKYGYKTLVVWEKELKNLDILKEKIWKFNEKINLKNWTWIYDKTKDDFFASHNRSIRGKFFAHEFGVYSGGAGGGGEISSHTYFYYKVFFPSHGILRTEPIYVYNSTGTLLYTLGPNDSRVDYENGVWEVPGSERNETVESISTASFWINYSSSKLQIDYENLKFKIDKSLIPSTALNSVKVTADFEYATALAPIDQGRNIFDGRWDTQAQVVFYAKPPAGYAFAVLDLGQEYTIQAIDIIHGFFKPDERRAFDINNKYSLQYSTDGTNYYAVCKEATNFGLSGGASVSFERDQIGDDFSVRYFKLIIEDMNKIEYGNGCWVAAFTEFAAYQDVVLSGDALLIPTTKLDGAYAGSPLSGAGTQVNLTVKDTTAFDTTGTAYIADIAFTYGGKTTTVFQHCSGAGIYPAQASGTYIYQDLASTVRLLDEDGMLHKMGDVLYKDTALNPFLDTQAKVDKRAGDYLTEFKKNHHNASIDVLYAPHLRVAQTVLLTDSVNRISRRYFIESLRADETAINLTLSYYP